MIFDYWWGLLIGISACMFFALGVWWFWIWYKYHMAYIARQINDEIQAHIRKYHQVKK